MIENISLKNSKARSSTIYYINNIKLFANIIISKSLFEFKSFSREENNTKTKEKKFKKKFSEDDKKANR